MKNFLYVMICTIAILFAGCCDQTFIIYKGEQIPVSLNREVHEYYNYGQSSGSGVIEVTNQGSGSVDYNSGTGSVDYSNSGTGSVDYNSFNYSNAGAGNVGYNNSGTGSVDYSSSGMGYANSDRMLDISNPDQRMIRFHITADYPSGEMKDAKITIDGKNFGANGLLDTGSHSYTIQKPGYTPITDSIPAGTSDYEVSKQLSVMPRAVNFRFTDAKTGATVTPTEVKIGLERIQDGAMVKPCSKTLKVVANGYKNFEEAYFNLPVGEGAYTLARKLTPLAKDAKSNVTTVVTAKQTELQLQIIDDCFEEEIVPEKVQVDGNDVRTGSSITAGNHKVVMMAPGFEKYQASFTVPAGVETYVLNATMISLPRALDIDIQYDVEPSSKQSRKLGDCQISLTKKYSNETKRVKKGDKVKPGTYDLKIDRTAYISIERQLRIWPASSSFAIKEKLEAKPRILKTNISFDKQTSGEYVVDFIDVDTKIRRNVKPDGFIKPGKYDYVVTKPGYEMEGSAQRITIEPDEEPFEITAKMKAAARQISFEDPSINGVHVRPIEISINGEKYQFTKKYYPGKYHVIAKFKEQRPIETDIVIEPGVDTFVVNLNF